MRVCGHLGELLDHRVVDLVLHEQPAAGAAALALVEVQPEHRAFERGIQVGVGEDDVRALAAELERDPLEGVGGARHDDPADLGRAGEGDLVDARVLDERRAGRLAIAGDDVDDARREAGLQGQLAQAQARSAGFARPA